MSYCPKCQAPARVLETRYSPRHKVKRRRLGCTGCGYRWTLLGDAAYYLGKIGGAK